MNTYKFKPCQIAPGQTIYVDKDRYAEFVQTYSFTEGTNKQEYLAQAIAEGWVKN